jgi:hypothetical protein
MKQKHAEAALAVASVASALVGCSAFKSKDNRPPAPPAEKSVKHDATKCPAIGSYKTADGSSSFTLSSVTGGIIFKSDLGEVKADGNESPINGNADGKKATGKCSNNTLLVYVSDSKGAKETYTLAPDKAPGTFALTHVDSSGKSTTVSYSPDILPTDSQPTGPQPPPVAGPDAGAQPGASVTAPAPAPAPSETPAK